MTIKIVIARYTENIEWANIFDNCLIYNKSDGGCATKHPIINLPNVGREGHTYLHHIITNYNNLDDYTIFLQGRPFDHSPNVINTIGELHNNINNNGEKISFKFISERIIPSNISGCPFFVGFDLIVPYKNTFNLDKTEHAISFGAGAQFIVSRDAILSRSLDFYKNILSMMDKEINPVYGYCLERFWEMIFTHSE